jgi:predicted TIM-barrel fold metal-dependent hydrolase
LSPNCFRWGAKNGLAASVRERLDGLFARTQGNPGLYPFFWIDPMEEDAEKQVDVACGYGVSGFKVICDRFYPYDERPMAVFRKIASAGKPLLFHSGILWDGKFSSVYNRPAGFESLLNIGGLRFSLAHASWPWIDECIAVFGKFLNARAGNDVSSEMFIDITPGTPEIYRRELLVKLFTVGYDVEDNVVFGTDCDFDEYNDGWARKWAGIDAGIYRDLKLDGGVMDKIFGGNLKRFAGIASEKIMRTGH